MKYIPVFQVYLIKPLNMLQSNSIYTYTYIHTYIHNWPLQPFSQNYGLASLITYVVCIDFIRELWDLQFNVDPERQIFWETFSWQVYLLSEFLQKPPKKYFYISFLMTDLAYEPRLLRLISRLLTRPYIYVYRFKCPSLPFPIKIYVLEIGSEYLRNREICG